MNAFSWLLTRQQHPRVLSRFVLVDRTLLRTDRIDGEWDVQWVTRLHSFDGSVLTAVAETAARERRGFILDGGVWITETDVDAEALAAECIGRMGTSFGPLLHALLLETPWKCM